MSKETAGQFDALLAEIQGQTAETDTLAKSMAEGDDAARIEAAAAEGEEAGEGEDDKDKDKDGEEGEAFGKSYVLRAEDGTETEGYDATELLKSLVGQVGAIELNTKTVLEAALGLIAKQGTLLKSLNDKVVALGSRGAGRRSVVTVAEPPAGLAKSLTAGGAAATEEGGMNSTEFLNKAFSAAEAGLCSYHEVNLSETLINKGAQPTPAAKAAVAQLVAQGK